MEQTQTTIIYIMAGSSLYFLLYFLNHMFYVATSLVNENNDNTSGSGSPTYLDIYLKTRETTNKEIYNMLCSFFTLLNECKNFTNNNIKLIFFHNCEDCAAIEDEDSATKEKENVVVKPEIKYEDKYLEQIRALPDEYIFTEEEMVRQEFLFDEFLKNAKTALINEKWMLKNDLNSCLQELSDIENIEFSEDDKNVTYDEDGDEIAPFEDRIEEKKNYYINEIDRIKTKLCVLNEKELCENEVRETVVSHIINEKLDTLKNNFIIEKTPLGNVLMFYNNKKETFEYYSDNSIPYRFLEVVSRKYVLTFKCRFLYVDMEKELQKYEKKLAEKEMKEKELQEKALKEKELQEKDSFNNSVESTSKKSVFAKFKSYNKDAGSGRVNKAPPPKNSIPNNKVSKTDNENVLLKEKSNHYTCEGKFANFNILKKVDRKVVDKKYSMTFADFKKSMINKK
jgi:hypothetical protein